MIDNLPTYISLTFGLTTIVTLVLFIWTIRNSNSERTRKKAMPIFIGLTIWLTIQAVLTLQNSYNLDTNSFPPKIILTGILPTILTIILLFATSKGRQFIDSLPLKNLTYLNIVRVPVEIILFWLFLNKVIPELMTFEGRNFDILAGITAPVIAYFGLTKTKLNRQTILIWNLICLGLLINIVVNALFSAPSPIQKFAFEQPNIAILNFPFSWLPTFIVPIVLFGHLTSIRQLLKRKNHKTMEETNLNWTTGQAIQDFYDKHDFGEEGGINEKYAWIKFGFFSIPIPNTESRRNNVYLHDVSHIVTGHNTTWKGESAVSAWEIASGGWKNLYLPWLLTLWAMGLGVLFYPSSVLRSFRQGLTMNNALTCKLSKEEIYKLSVSDLRQLLSNKPKSNKNPYLWMLISFLTFLTPFVIGLIFILTLIKLF